MTSATASSVVRFLGLSEVAETATGEASFPLGILYPYSRDLQRVCSCFDDLCQEFPDTASSLLGGMNGTAGSLPGSRAPTVAALLAAIATLHGRIAFAPGHAGASVSAAYRLASDAVGSALTTVAVPGGTSSTLATSTKLASLIAVNAARAPRASAP